MTAMERTEELVHNLLVAQNELIAHLLILKDVPNLARALFGSVKKNPAPEKNSTLEKNSTPEKNSSEMEKIRQTWMDDVVLLASEFFINEEAFNLENLTELLKATVVAITDILALGPEENWTCIDQLAVDHPDYVNEKYFGGASGCPWVYDYNEKRLCDRGTMPASHIEANEQCRRCWLQPYKPQV